MKLNIRSEVIREGVNHKGQKYKVIAFYGNCGFLYTKTTIFDAEGYAEMSVTVYADGQVDIR